jgi:lipid II:glycine glycyltransferase (peptidoglycan interpeptide bridge formation enzyme)
MLNSNWQVEVDTATPAEWSQMLDLFDDANLYQTWSYGGVRWGEKSLSHLVLKSCGEIAGMAQLRIVRPTRFNFGIAYLRWGPIFERRGQPLNPEVAAAIARALEDEYAGRRKLFLRVLPNAFVGSPRAAAIQSSFSGLSPETGPSAKTYRTLVLDLDPSIEALRRNLDKKWRNQLTRAEKNGLTVRAGCGPDEYGIFCRTYHQMRERKSFDTTVDVEEFGRIQEDLAQPARMRIWICEQEGEPVAGIVVSAMGNSAIYLLGATSDNGLNAKGAYLLQWTAIQWLKENGFRWYDLGGIDPERNPGVYHFKRGLCGADLWHMNQMGGSGSIVSSTIVNAAEAAQRALRACRNGLRRAGTAIAPSPGLLRRSPSPQPEG